MVTCSPSRDKAKRLLADEMARQQQTVRTLSKASGLQEMSIRRALDMNHGSSFGSLQAVAGALGKRLAIEVVDA